MSTAPALRALVQQRLAVAAEEICGLFEGAMAELQEEIKRQRTLLEARVELRRTGADISKLNVRKDEFLAEQQNETFSLDQEDAESSHVQEEHVQLNTPDLKQEVAVTEFHPIPVKIEKDQDIHCSQTQKRKDSGQESLPDYQITPPSETDPKLRRDKKSSKASQNHSGFHRPKDCVWCKRPFCCSACGKRFTTSSNLKVHVRIHTGEKPFSCTLCSKSFAQKVQLKFHLARHTGEKLFSCSKCDQRFDYLYQLKKHQCVQTGLHRRETQTDVLGLKQNGDPLSCYECSETFGHKTHFKENALRENFQMINL